MVSNFGRETSKMVTYGKASIFYTLICFYLILGIHYSSTLKTIYIQTGGSVTIPCHYDRKYTQNRKYWYSERNHSNKYTNTTEENLSVIDYPDQSLFTVTMRNLQENQRGRYYCILETEGPSSSSSSSSTPVLHDFYLQIQSVPDLSVVNSRVTGLEGGNISVQCLYSSGYMTMFKQWCRFEENKCYTEGRTDTSQNSSVQISDDGRESFTVVMTGLRESDSGWYWCAVHELRIYVQLTVNKRKPDINTENDMKKTFPFVWLSTSAAVLLLLILIGVFIWRCRKRHNEEENKNRIRERSSAKTSDKVSCTPKDTEMYCTINDDNPNTSSSLDPSTNITYSTIAVTSGCKSHCPADGVIYSTVAQH
ncbi:polymeric immunoglobulin receptor-like isoform X1 [Xyrauchen texanus]|uniref:polymeric immunoglobulin receptor-like isoform X1 n=1 Tax=Xyrauchen texanus TaxID=154827 RepID=UPI0022424C87|nr:polymeric immunoglobulin receptor-like isoform X1 [Xyrauchen texanus]